MIIAGGCLLVVVCTLAFVAVILEFNLREQLVSHAQAALRHQFATAGETLVARWPDPESPAALDELAGEVGRLLGVRVGFVAEDGRVLADSRLDPARVAKLESHADRPEVMAALQGRRGTSIRPSGVLGETLLYEAGALAVPGRPRLVLRLSVPLAEVEATLARSRRLIGGALMLGVLLAVGVTYLVARGISQPIRALKSAAGAIAGGEFSRRVRRYPGHEVGDLSRAFDAMADTIQEKIAELTQARNRLEAILWGMSEGVLVTDRGGRIILANQALLELLGLARDPVGRMPSEIVRNADLVAAMRQARLARERVAREIRLLEPRPRALEMQVVPLSVPDTEAGCVAVLHDISERKRVEEIRRDFVANVSHELRTPLTAIRGATETLLDGALDSPADARRFVEMIHRHADRLSRLAQDLLELARLENGKAGGQEREAVEAGELADTLLGTVAAQAGERGITLRLAPPEGEIRFLADRRSLEQALLNLLDNAIKYTEPGGQVTLGFAADAATVRAAVSDTGVGIPPEHQERIFERFYRVDKNRSRELGGTGLGLAIVKHLVQTMHGRIELASQPGRAAPSPDPAPRGRPRAPAPPQRLISQSCFIRSVCQHFAIGMPRRPRPPPTQREEWRP